LLDEFLGVIHVWLTVALRLRLVHLVVAEALGLGTERLGLVVAIELKCWTRGDLK